MSDPNQYENWDKDPKNWKFGIFYYNENDDRIFVSKKNPFLGFTLNFGNIYSSLIVAAVIILVISFS